MAVVLRDCDGNFQEVYRLADLSWDLLLETGAVTSPMPFAAEEIERRTLFVQNLRSEGIPL